MSDGISTKDIWTHSVPGSGSATDFSDVQFDLIVFLRAGDSLSASSGTIDTRIAGSHRQIATGDGTLVNPVGYPL
jgi:hypothetical protein